MNRTLIAGTFAYAVFAALPCGHIPVPNVNADDIDSTVNTGVKAANAGIDIAKCEKLRDQKPSYDEEQALGGAVAVNLAAGNGGIIATYDNAEESQMKDPQAVKFTDSPGTRASEYVNVVGKNLAVQSGRPNIAWKFGVLNVDGINGFSAPGGYVFITKGVLKQVKNEDQLAGVLAHEISHIVLRHAVKQYVEQKVTGCRLAAGAKSDMGHDLENQGLNAVDPTGFGREMADLADRGSDAFNLNQNLDVLTYFTDKMAEQIVKVGYSHDSEYDADKGAVDLLMGAGYSVKEYENFLRALPGGGAFQNHPSGADRADRVHEYIAKKLTSDDAKFLPQPKKPIDDRAQLEGL